MADYVIGADLGGTKIELGLVDPADRIIARKRIPTEDARGAASVVERIADCVDELASHLPAQARIAAFGMCTPGRSTMSTVSYSTRRISRACITRP
jgi:glucokinase